MDSITSLHARPKTWLANSVLAPHAAAFATYLAHARYSSQSRGTYVASLAHLGRWMSQCCLPLGQLDEAAVELFLYKHLPRCDCPTPVVRTRSALRAACTHLLRVLREQRVIVEPAGASGPIAEELDRYDAHLREARGLSEGTRRGGLRLVQRLLRYKFADGRVVFAQLQPEDVRQFIATQLDLRRTTSNAMALTSALRGYFRYRTSLGDRVHGLVGVIASPAHWSLAPLPRALRPFEVKRLLSSFTAELPSPRRGYAMVRCALDLTHGRSHALRHTLACRLLDQGGSIKEVADVLRHRSLNTTLIYAKLDHPRLAAVALPWPGSST